MEALVTRQEVARLLRCSLASVHRLMRQEGLPSLKVGGKTLFRPADIDVWLQTHTCQASTELDTATDDQQRFTSVRRLSTATPASPSDDLAITILDLIDKWRRELHQADPRRQIWECCQLLRSYGGWELDTFAQLLDGPDRALLARAFEGGLKALQLLDQFSPRPEVEQWGQQLEQHPQALEVTAAAKTRKAKKGILEMAGDKQPSSDEGSVGAGRDHLNPLTTTRLISFEE